jgi:hypothetical protein
MDENLIIGGRDIDDAPVAHFDLDRRFLTCKGLFETSPQEPGIMIYAMVDLESRFRLSHPLQPSLRHAPP